MPGTESAPKRRAFVHAPVLDDHIQQNKKKKNQNLPEIVYLAIEIKQKIRYDHRQSHL